MTLRQKLENDLNQFKEKKRKELQDEIAALEKAVKRKVEKAGKIKIQTDLLSAISTNNTDAIQALVELKADPNFMYKDEDDYRFSGRKITPLLYAISQQKPTAMESLIAAKADPNLKTPPYKLGYYHQSGCSTLQHTYPSESPIGHAIDHSIYRHMREDEYKQQPVQWSNGAGQCRDVLSQQNIIFALLNHGAEITEDAIKTATKDGGLSTFMAPAIMKSSFMFFRKNKYQGESRNKEIPAVEMPETLTKLIASYM